LAVGVGVAGVEGVEDCQHSGAAVGVEAPGEVHGAVAAGAHVQFAAAFGFVGGGGAVGVEVGE
jgi:alpha-acetolactate decarboxylase